MAAQHTPGPWRLTGKATIRHGDPHTGGWIADVHWKNRDANARLILSAPELLAALSALVEFCDDPEGSEKGESLAMGMARLLPAARTALANAKGME